MDRNKKIQLLKLIGFNEKKCEETLKNDALSNELIDLISQVIIYFLIF